MKTKKQKALPSQVGVRVEIEATFFVPGRGVTLLEAKELVRKSFFRGQQTGCAQAFFGIASHICLRVVDEKNCRRLTGRDWREFDEAMRTANVSQTGDAG